MNSSDSDSDAPKKRKPKPKAAPGSLFDVKWYRIVVDEAQNIKNHKTQTAKAAVELRAKYRWCLTGTPIQNNVEELYSLFKFLRARPLDDWQTFKERISSQVKEGRTGIAMKRLHIILKSIMLRRTKNATIGRCADGVPADLQMASRSSTFRHAMSTLSSASLMPTSRPSTMLLSTRPT